jgi:uncharacterized protein (TIRG00374 family)
MKDNNIQNPLYKYKKLIFIFIIILLTVIVTITNQENIELALYEVINIDFAAVVILIIMLIIYLVSDSYILKVSIDSEKLGFHKSFLINMAGSFFSGITPMYMGSYPSRLYYLYKEDVPVDKTLSALTIKGLTYQIVVCILGVIALFTSSANILATGGYIVFLILGLIWNVGIVIFLLLISSSLKVNTFFVRIVEKLSEKISGLRKRKTEVMDSITNYYQNTQRIYQDRKYFLKVLFFTVVKVVVFHLFPLVVFYGLGMDIKTHFIDIISLSCLMAIIVSVFPAPGGMVASEAVFVILYGLIYSAESTVDAGLLIWRLFTYYIVIIIGLVATLILQSKEPKNRSLRKGGR